MTSKNHLLFLDFETYYDDEYSLKKLTPPEYILDPRYETIGCAVADGDEPTYWVDGPDFAGWLRQFPPEKTTTVTFNALFDNCILAWRYGYIPARMLCSMRMAVALRGHMLQGASLKYISQRLGLGEKGTTIENVKGLRRSEIMSNPALWRAFQSYGLNDNELQRALFWKLAPEFPSSERRVMDLVLRCAVEPRFTIDTAMLTEHLADLRLDKIISVLAAAGQQVSPEDLTPDRLDATEERSFAFAKELRSNPKFQKLLEARGVDIEYKSSMTDGAVDIPAFAKTDEFMAELLEHADPIVQALATARLGVRSTIEQTRGQRMLTIGSLPWQQTGMPGTMPIPLRYAGAHTHRLSGEWKINPQNMPSGRGKVKSKLRKSLAVKPDEEVVVADLSQIECRVNAWLCGQRDLLDVFRFKDPVTGKPGDPYAKLACSVFALSTVAKDSLERFIGKGGTLGLGFGCGADKFYNMVIRDARKFGMEMKALLAMWSPGLAQKTVDIYRSTNTGITSAWRTLTSILQTAWIGASGPIKWGPVEIGHGYVLLPNGLKMQYDIVTPVDAQDLRYRYGKSKNLRMYGPKFLENIVQALARIIVMNAALRIADRGYKFALQAHDELVFVVKKADSARCKAIVLEEMRRVPSWAPSLPLDAECGIAATYGDAKT